MTELSLERISFSYAEKQVLRDLSFSFSGPGGYAVLGPSGCGKTTLLRLIAGLEKPTVGRILRPEGFSVSFCFQEDRLLPWASARENIALVLRGPQRTERAQSWLERVGLSSEGDRLPAALSGGMKRRVALARALAFEAPVLLLDEPFRALDDQAHAAMLRLVQEEADRRLCILVTHDARDAADMKRLVLAL